MELRIEDSRCNKNDSRIVSEEKGRKHIANNINGKYDVRYYRLDGELVIRQLCCDYLLVNDSTKKAYYIELKGQDIQHAVDQVIAGEAICKDSLKGYTSFFRIIPHKSPTTRLMPVNFRHLLNNVGKKRLICKNNVLEEDLD